MKDFKKIGEIHHKNQPQDGAVGDMFINTKTGKYHHEGSAGDGPDSEGHDNPDSALKAHKKQSVPFLQREADMSSKDAHAHVDGFHLIHDKDQMNKAERKRYDGKQAADRAVLGAKVPDHPFSPVAVGTKKITVQELIQQKEAAKAHNADKKDKDQKAASLNAVAAKPLASKLSKALVPKQPSFKQAGNKAAKTGLMKSDEPRSTEHKGHTIERVGGSYTSAERGTISTPETQSYRVTTPKGELVSTEFSSVDHAKKHIDKGQMNKSEEKPEICHDLVKEYTAKFKTKHPQGMDHPEKHAWFRGAGLTHEEAAHAIKDMNKAEHPAFEANKGKIQEIKMSSEKVAEAQSGMHKVEYMAKAKSDDGYLPAKKRSLREERSNTEVKGVHAPSYSSGKDQGQSEAGDSVRQAASKGQSAGYKKAIISNVKEEHTKRLSELKAMPKAKLTKAEDEHEFHSYYANSYKTRSHHVDVMSNKDKSSYQAHVYHKGTQPGSEEGPEHISENHSSESHAADAANKWSRANPPKGK